MTVENLPVSISKELTKEIYRDLAKPGVQQVGKAIGSVTKLLNTLLLPVDLLNEYACKNFEKFRKKLENIDEENICEIPPEIGLPLLQKLFYISNEDLSDLFVNLLARASKKDESHLAHPSFANILSSLSPDEARILKEMSINGFLRCLSLRWEKRENDDTTVTYFYTKRAYSGLEKNVEIIYPENYYLYYTNMSSLGLVQFQEDSTLDEYLSPSEEYDHLKNFYKEIFLEGEKNEEDYVSRVMLGRVDLTELGEMFIKACTNEDDSIVSRKEIKRIETDFLGAYEQAKNARLTINDAW